MTSISTTPPAVAAPARSLSAPAHAAPQSTGAIDPIRLINKYKWLLLASAALGLAVGTAANFALKQVYPVYSSNVLFQCTQPSSNVAELFGTTSGTEEMNRFMQTQVRIMTSDEVLRRVTEDPALERNAPLWFAKHASNGVIDPIESLKDLKEDVKARVLPGTNLIELSMSWRDKYNTTAVVGLVKQKYLDQVQSAGRINLDDRIAALGARVTDLDRQAGTLGTQKETLIQTKQIDSIDNRIEAVRSELAEANGKLIDVQQELDARRTLVRQMEAELMNPGGVVYGDELQQQVESSPSILDIKRDLQQAENSLQAFKEAGVMPEHRQYVALEANIRALRQNLEAKKGEELKKMFAARLDASRKSVEALEAQQNTLTKKREESQLKLTDLTRTQSQLNDLDTKLRGVLDARSKINADLQQLLAQQQINSASRVQLMQSERVPNQLTFPQLKIMLPGGMALFLGLTAGIVLLRELVDQRVKSPSDIQLIPRTRLVGWVPDGAEDPSGPGAIETAFRDRPRGIVAESFRQVRSAISKRMGQTDHRTLLVLGGMPASGATSVAANLALAFAAADKRVLLIDANFRRPSLHRVFSLQENPGLADVLGKAADVAQAVQATSTPNLDLLSAGSKELRVFERLAAEGTGELLAKVRSIYDMVIIDVAPAVVGGDALALAQRTDATLLVVRALADKRGMVARIKNELSETKSELLGIVVNGVRAASGGYMKRNIRTAHEYQAD
jgi:capsular exopolysaccharide synthesis family protein